MYYFVFSYSTILVINTSITNLLLEDKIILGDILLDISHMLPSITMLILGNVCLKDDNREYRLKI